MLDALATAKVHYFKAKEAEGIICLEEGGTGVSTVVLVQTQTHRHTDTQKRQKCYFNTVETSKSCNNLDLRRTAYPSIQ